MSFIVERTMQGGGLRLETVVYRPVGQSSPLPLLFVHGAWHGAWCWEEYFLPYFAGKGFSSIALSFRGHGGSEGVEFLSRFRLADYVDDLAAVAEVIGVRFGRPPLLIGHSLGGFVVQKYLENHNAPGSVLMASVPPSGLTGASWRLFLKHPVVTTLSLLTASPNWLIRVQEIARESFFSSSLSGSVITRFCSLLQPESAKAMLDLYVPISVDPRLKSMPVLVMGASEDQLFSHEHTKSVAAVYGTTPVVIHGSAHDIMLDTEWRTAADHILSWLHSNGLSGSPSGL